MGSRAKQTFLQRRHTDSQQAFLIIREMQIKTTMRYHLTPIRLAITKKKKKKSPHTSAGEDVERREPSYTVGGKVNWYSQYREQYEDSLKKKTLKIELRMILPPNSWVYIQRKI